jgi:hypothetical protein
MRILAAIPHFYALNRSSPDTRERNDPKKLHQTTFVRRSSE